MRIHGHSMLPLLRPGTVVIVDERAYARRPPRRGEIVAVRAPRVGGEAAVKRITGVPNEPVTVGARTWYLGADEYFLLGDQAHDSLDSRTLGPVIRQELIGPVWLRCWPPKFLEPVS